jgi:hypothetical protein
LCRQNQQSVAVEAGIIWEITSSSGLVLGATFGLSCRSGGPVLPSTVAEGMAKEVTDALAKKGASVDAL